MYAEKLSECGRLSVQVMYDDKGRPIGDAANISKQIVTEMKAFDSAYGEDGQVEVDMTRIFNIEKRYFVDKELKTLEQAKQYIKQIKGGKK